MIAEMEIEEMQAPEKQIDETVLLDPEQKSPRARDFEDRLGEILKIASEPGLWDRSGPCAA